jgi:hypothetical protein
VEAGPDPADPRAKLVGRHGQVEQRARLVILEEACAGDARGGIELELVVVEVARERLELTRRTLCALGVEGA